MEEVEEEETVDTAVVVVVDIKLFIIYPKCNQFKLLKLPIFAFMNIL